MVKKLTKLEAVELYNKINIILSSNEEFNFSIIFSLTKTKTKLKSLFEEVREIQSVVKKKEQQLNLKYCSKDENGRPVISKITTDDGKKEIEVYAGLAYGLNSEFDEQMDKIREEMKKELSEIVNIDMHVIDKKELENLKTKACVFETLCSFIK